MTDKTLYAIVAILVGPYVLLIGIGLALWLSWRWPWRYETMLAGLIVGLRVHQHALADPGVRQAFPHMTAAAAGIGEVLLGSLAAKYRTSREAVEKELIKNTGAASLEEALRSPYVLQEMYSTLLTTRNPFRFLARLWLEREERETARLRQLGEK